MTVGLIGAMEEEVAILKDKMEKIHETETAHCRFYEGTLNGLHVVLLQSGIGKVNAAIGTTLLIERFRPSLVINTGSAGGLDANLEIGDVVISTEMLYHDVDATAFGYLPGQLPAMPPAFPADPSLIRLAERAAGGTPGIRRTVCGPMASGDVFMSDPKRIARLKATFPKVKAVEMEGAAIAHVCYQCDVPFLVVRSLSDIAGKQSDVSFDRFLKKAAKHSALFVIHLLKEIDSFDR